VAEPLALPTDVTNRYAGSLTTEDTTRVPALLADASAVVRSFTRQQFAAATTTERIRPIGSRVRLRQSPVTAVGSLAIVDPLQDGELLVLPVGVWMWDGGQEIWLGEISPVINVPDEATLLLRYGTPLVQVSYTHGYPTVPDDVVTVVCSMVIRTLDTPGPTSMVMSTVDGLTYKLGGTAQDGVLGLTPSEQRVLAPYRRTATTVELR
jgi:hypothetical protein